MTAEVLVIVISAAGILIALGSGLFAGFAWVLRRMDDRFDKVDVKFDKVHAKFDNVQESFGKMSAQIGELRTELNEVKVSVARLEGPQQRLILPR